MPLTDFGKFIRNIRLENKELLRHMAVKLEVSSSFLSSVENGKESIPGDWPSTLTHLYDLSDEQRIELNSICVEPQLLNQLQHLNKVGNNIEHSIRNSIPIEMLLDIENQGLGHTTITELLNVIQNERKNGNTYNYNVLTSRRKPINK